MKRFDVLRICCLPLALTFAWTAIPIAIHGQTLFSENFDTDHTANWAVNASAGTHPVNVFFDYGTVGVPSAPNSGGTTRGLKLQANTVGGVLGGVSVSPAGQSFTGNYRLRFDLWMNFNGPLGSGGNGSTQFGGAGIGTRGVTPQWSGGTLEGVWFAGTGEGGTTLDYRAYSATVNNYAPASGVYAAGTGTSPDARNNLHPYYAGFGGKTAPAAQLASYPQQTGSTPVGTLGFTWLDVTVTKSGNLVSWTVNGVPFATVNAVGISLSTNILLNYFDLNATTSTDPNAPALLFALFDNVRVEVIPAVFSVFGGGGYCSGGSGVAVQLSGSETGVDYLLRTNGVYAGVTFAGTGAAINFGNQTATETYTVLASNTLSATTLVMSGTAVVMINPPPAITGGPTPASAFKSQGDTLSISITAAGAGLTYQWQRDGTNLANGGNISGATSATLALNPLQLTDTVGAGHGYTCVVSGDCAPSTASGEATLTVVPQNHWKGDGAANQWDFVTANWFEGLYQDGGNITFDDFGSNNVPVDIITTVSPSWITVNSTGTYVFSGSGSITGGGGFTKMGSGELKLATSNSFANTAQVFAGRVTIQNNHALGTTNGATVVGIPGANNGASLQLDGNGISVAEPLVLNRWDASFPSTNGALVNLANTNVWSGPITLAEGTVVHSASGRLTLNSTTPIAGPGYARFSGEGDIVIQSGIRADVTSLEFSGAATKTLTGTNASSGGLGVFGGSRVVVAPWSLGSGPLSVQFGCTIEINAGGGSANFGNQFWPAGGKLRVSGGTVSYNGTMEVQLANGCIFETASSSDRLVFDTPVRELPAVSQIGYITISGPGTVVFNAGLSPGLHGWPGGWLIDGSTVLLNHTNALSQQRVSVFNGATLRTAVNGGVYYSYELSAGNCSFLPGRGTLGAGVSNYFDSLQLSGHARIAPGTNLTAGSTAEVGFGTGRLFSDSVLSVENDGGVNTHVTIDGGISEEFGTMSVLTKAGNGTLVLRSTDPFPYRGGTVVSNGTLVVANTTGSITGPGDVTVHDGATLMGNGRISGSVTVKSGGTLAAGASIGALAISNSLIFEAGATNVVEVNLASGTNDSVYGLTNVVYAGTLVVSNVGPQAITNGAAFKIFDSLTYSGAFAALLPSTPGPGMGWDVSTLATDGTLRVQAGYVSPILANPIPNQTNTYGSAFTFIFALNTFSDPDPGQTLSYAASNLPPGISFSGPPRTFSGTPTNVGIYAVTVTATDDGTPPLGTNDVFNFVITPATLTVTANDVARYFGQANPPLTGTLLGVTNGDNITVTFDTAANPASPAGNYPITPVFSDPDNRLLQYAVTTNLGTLTVICATNLVVTTTNDSGAGSLREAITLANASCAPTPVLISFNIPGAGVHSIAPLTALPGITRPVVIDGYTQPGASANTLPLGSDAVLLIELSGTNIPGNIGLYLGASAAGSTVRGLVVSHFSYGIALDFVQNTVVEGCFIGTDAAGTNAQRNDVGIAMSSGSGHRIGGLTPAARNVISGNSPERVYSIIDIARKLLIENYVGLGADGLLPLPNGAGLYVSYAATGNQIGGTDPAARNVISANGDGCYDTSDGGNFIQGNFIGTDATGTQNRGNIIGVTLIGNGSVVGGATAGAGNLISGRNSTALIINGASNVVAGNFFGTDVTGRLALGNEYDGLLIYGSSNVIGGSIAAARNVIAANRYAVFFVNPNAAGNRVIGNFIGTDVTGTNALGNNSGVVAYAAPANLIGGEAAGEGNVISGNTNSAIYLTELISTNYVIQGNFIGTDVTGDVLLPNGSGIYVGTADNVVGGTNLGAGNFIAGNNGVGVTIDFYSHATNNTILGNRIFGNGALGIDLAGAGANDVDDADEGSNHFQNSPALTNVMVGNGLVQLSYAVDSAPANAAYPMTIEFFLADSLASGEGRTLIHRHTYDTPQAFTNITFMPSTAVNAADPIVATATDANGNTSEFSPGVAVTTLPAPPIIEFPTILAGGGFQFSFTNAVGATFQVLASTNVALPMGSWTAMGPAIEISPGQFQFTDLQATNGGQRFYGVRSP